ncbi:MAG: nitroreductase [Bacteroidaceae bacterium]|nr:nitroreductase [Bacteroidaceae bacterium]
MTIKEAIFVRHTVRKYKDVAIDADIVRRLNERIDYINKEHDLNIKLVLNNGNGIWTFMKIFFAKNVKNYLVLAGKNREGIDEELGYYGAELMLFAQTLGLNSWWVGGTYNKSVAASTDGSVTTGVIVLGYGLTNGEQHKSKQMAEVCSYKGDMPKWFKDGIESILLAPTAMNKQGFFLEGDGRKVTLTCKNGQYTGTDKGIVKYHFEVAAGKENFEWA